MIYVVFETESTLRDSNQAVIQQVNASATATPRPLTIMPFSLQAEYFQCWVGFEL